VYFYWEGNAFWAVLCVLVYRVVLLAATARPDRRRPRTADECASAARWYNCVLIYTFGVDHVVKHPAADELFAKFLENGKAPAPTLEEWRESSCPNSYRRKYKREDGTCEVRFNIKNNLLLRMERSTSATVFTTTLRSLQMDRSGQTTERASFSGEIEAQLAVRVAACKRQYCFCRSGGFSKGVLAQDPQGR